MEYIYIDLEYCTEEEYHWAVENNRLMDRKIDEINILYYLSQEERVLQDTRYKSGQSLRTLLSTRFESHIVEIKVGSEGEVTTTIEAFHITEIEWNSLQRFQSLKNEHIEEFPMYNDEPSKISFQKLTREKLLKEFYLQTCPTPFWLSSTEFSVENYFSSSADSDCGVMDNEYWIFYIVDVDRYGIASE